MKDRFIEEPARRTPVLDEAEVLVVGGGTAGMMAALAAARNGARTILVEAAGFLGGVTTMGVGMTINNAAPAGVELGGFTSELLHELVSTGGLDRGKVTVDDGPRRTRFWQEPERLKTLAFDRLRDAGAKILLRSPISSGITEGGRAAGGIFEAKGGRFAIRSQVLIDCTGDADASAYLGAAYEVTPKPGMMAANINFVMGDVDLSRAPVTDRNERRGLESEADACWKTLVSEARSKGYLSSLPEGVHPGWYGGEPLRPNTAIFNCIRVVGLDWLDPEDLTQGEYQARRQMHDIVVFLRDCVPGFEKAYVQQTSPFLLVRGTRRIIGVYTITEEDIVERRKFEDGVVRCDNLIDDVLPGGRRMAAQELRPDEWYHIPYRAMIPKAMDGLLAAGRCISATHRAQAAIRPMSTCMAMGEVAGTAAAMAVSSGIEPRHLRVPELIAKLEEQGMRPRM